jgi:hypothetical protein
MSIGLNKFSRILRKWKENSKFVNNPFNVSVLSMEADSRALLGESPDSVGERLMRAVSCF